MKKDHVIWVTSYAWRAHPLLDEQLRMCSHLLVLLFVTIILIGLFKFFVERSRKSTKAVRNSLVTLDIDVQQTEGKV